ncbi:MAG TPA: homoserine dehydrogenase [Gammaproteobacteria bacterium]|uniref:homoserine dehydrogenase n=1 Tax=Immundisolibacter sp. TaxID=1934948 RepID=UPI000E8CAA2F|nr:homoserine dehydrogenase [Gammaproteobacteria bacterium]HCZ48980.1 homoserine dehydrogenase [Gammaproteobacteria bacterium]MCH78418.1 homoserine dehydrogenase [Gammaproteobacteria bacterium]
MTPVRIGLLGLGTVGGGTLELLARNGDEIARRAGRPLQVTHAAVRNPDRPRGAHAAHVERLTDPFELVHHPDIDIVAELIGGLEPARELVLAAIGAGKHVVTANKALIAHHGNEIFDAARRAGVAVGFEAAVAGGIPIIKTLREGLAGNRIDGLAGIINGTANYILTQMRDAGLDFATALADAQRLGYAEADPSFDIDGVDAAHKLAILASIAFGMPLCFDQVQVHGIRNLSAVDVDYAGQLGYRLKLLGIARRSPAGVQLRVHPTLLPQRHLLAQVDGVINAVLVDSDALGQSLYYGAGAGAGPTASAVVADLVDIARALTIDPEHRVPYLAFHHDHLQALPVLPDDAVESAFYLRLTALDQPGVLADVTRILGDLGISIEAILQKEPAPGASHVAVILLTHTVRERALRDAIARIEALPSIDGSVVSLHLDHLEH